MYTNPKLTVRSDWMTEVLASHHYYVSGHTSFATQLGLNSSDVAAIRHFRLSANFPEVIFLTLECLGEQPDLKALFNNPIFAEIKEIFPMIHTLIISHLSNSFHFQIDDSESLDNRGLYKWFSDIDKRYGTDLGGVKDINVSRNDRFVDWTRQNLTRNCVINDIDALLCPKNGLPGVLIELKRPRGDIRNWGPYLDDRGNYQSCALIADSCGLENRTIAYNVDNNQIVRLHMDVRWNEARRCLESRFALMRPELAVKALLDYGSEWRDHMSTNSRA